jgi:hypothetical protein
LGQILSVLAVQLKICAIPALVQPEVKPHGSNKRSSTSQEE